MLEQCLIYYNLIMMSEHLCRVEGPEVPYIAICEIINNKVTVFSLCERLTLRLNIVFLSWVY